MPIPFNNADQPFTLRLSFRPSIVNLALGTGISVGVKPAGSKQQTAKQENAC
jgi:hypothetical protein